MAVAADGPCRRRLVRCDLCRCDRLLPRCEEQIHLASGCTHRCWCLVREGCVAPTWGLNGAITHAYASANPNRLWTPWSGPTLALIGSKQGLFGSFRSISVVGHLIFLSLALVAVRTVCVEFDDFCDLCQLLRADRSGLSGHRSKDARSRRRYAGVGDLVVCTVKDAIVDNYFTPN